MFPDEQSYNNIHQYQFIIDLLVLLYMSANDKVHESQS